MFLPHPPFFLAFRYSRQSVCLSLTWMLQWFGLDKDVWTRRPVVFSHSWYPYSISNNRMMCVEPLHHSLLLLMQFSLFPFLSLSVSVSLCLFLSGSFSFCLSLSHFLSPHCVHSGKLTLTCSPVHPLICCSAVFSFEFRPRYTETIDWKGEKINHFLNRGGRQQTNLKTLKLNVHFKNLYKHFIKNSQH